MGTGMSAPMVRQLQLYKPSSYENKLGKGRATAQDTRCSCDLVVDTIERKDANPGGRPEPAGKKMKASRLCTSRRVKETGIQCEKRRIVLNQERSSFKLCAEEGEGETTKRKCPCELATASSQNWSEMAGARNSKARKSTVASKDVQ